MTIVELSLEEIGIILGALKFCQMYDMLSHLEKEQKEKQVQQKLQKDLHDLDIEKMINLYYKLSQEEETEKKNKK